MRKKISARAVPTHARVRRTLSPSPRCPSEGVRTILDGSLSEPTPPPTTGSQRAIRNRLTPSPSPPLYGRPLCRRVSSSPSSPPRQRRFESTGCVASLLNRPNANSTYWLNPVSDAISTPPPRQPMSYRSPTSGQAPCHRRTRTSSPVARSCSPETAGGSGRGPCHRPAC